jgi:hypothetical protein
MIGQFEAVALRRDERERKRAMPVRSLHDRLTDMEALLLSLSILCLHPTAHNKQALQTLVNEMLHQREREGTDVQQSN